MSIDARVEYVSLNEDGSGSLHLVNRTPTSLRGQPQLHFASAPYEVTALNGLPIWGGDSFIMLGEIEIAKREGYTRISFSERDVFLAAVAEWHRRQRKKRVEQNCAFNCDAESACTCAAHRQYRDMTEAEQIGRVYICDPAHPHYGESGTLTGKVIMLLGKTPMAEVKLVDCKHGTDGCFVGKGQIRQEKRAPS